MYSILTWVSQQNCCNFHIGSLYETLPVVNYYHANFCFAKGTIQGNCSIVHTNAILYYSLTWTQNHSSKTWKAEEWLIVLWYVLNYVTLYYVLIRKVSLEYNFATAGHLITTWTAYSSWGWARSEAQCYKNPCDSCIEVIRCCDIALGIEAQICEQLLVLERKLKDHTRAELIPVGAKPLCPVNSGIRAFVGNTCSHWLTLFHTITVQIWWRSGPYTMHCCCATLRFVKRREKIGLLLQFRSSN